MEKVTEITDEDAYSKGFEEYHGRYLVACSMYRTSKWAWVNFFCASFLLSVELLFIIKAVTLATDNTSLLFEMAYWAVLMAGVLCVFPASMKPHFQTRVRRIFTTLGKGKYYYTIINEETAQEIQNLRTRGVKEEDLLKNGFIISVHVAVFGFAVILPAYSIYTGTFFEPQRSDGVVEGIPCVMWLPVMVDDNIVLVRICLVLTQYYLAYITGHALIAATSIIICVGHTLMYEFRALALAVRAFEASAKHTFIMQDRKTEWQKVLTLSLEDAIHHHEILLKIAEDYAETTYLVMLIFLVCTTGLMCLSAASLFSDIPFGSKMLFLVFTITELANTFALCYYGQLLLDAHDLVRSAIYDINWVKYSALLGKHVHIMLIRTSRPLSLSVGGFAEVNLDTWSQVVKTAVSYFSILLALK